MCLIFLSFLNEIVHGKMAKLTQLVSKQISGLRRAFSKVVQQVANYAKCVVMTGVGTALEI
jgi:hypothetical protein